VLVFYPKGTRTLLAYFCVFLTITVTSSSNIGRQFIIALQSRNKMSHQWASNSQLMTLTFDLHQRIWPTFRHEYVSCLHLQICSSIFQPLMQFFPTLVWKSGNKTTTQSPSYFFQFDVQIHRLWCILTGRYKPCTGHTGECMNPLTDIILTQLMQAQIND